MADRLQEWLARLCDTEDDASFGVLVLGKPTGPFDPVARWPEGAPTPQPIRGALQAALGSGRPVIQTADAAASAPSTDVLAVAFHVPGNDGPTARGALALQVPHRESEAQRPGLARLQEALLTLPALPRANGGGAPAPQAEGVPELEAEGVATDLVGAVLAAESAAGATATAARELARRLGAQRVAIGFAHGAVVRVEAISDSEHFDRRAGWVREIEDAMLEAFDQDVAVSDPGSERASEGPGARGRAVPVSRAHESLARRHAVGAVHSIPLRCGGRAFGVATAELPDDAAPGAPDALALEAGPLGPALHARRRAARSLVRHLRDDARQALLPWLGPGHLKAKAATAAAIVLALLLALMPAPFRVAAPARVQGSVQRAVVAPVDGYIAESGARAGDLVARGDVLGRLDTTGLELDRRKWLGRRAQLAKALRAAMATRDRTELSLLRARLDQAEAELGLVEEQLRRARLTAPFDGVVARGDLSQLLGSPVERGQVLFEVAPLEAFRVSVEVAESDIAYVDVGKQGQLTLAALPGEALRFEVARITPIATTDEDGTHFRVEAALASPPGGLRPGMEGVARIDADRRSLLWIWTRRVTGWLRLLAWSWLP